MRQKLFLFILLTGLSVILLGSPPPTAANIITVDGTCTLTDAIIAANTDTAVGDCDAGSPGADTIVLNVNVSLTSVYPGSTAIGGGQSGLPDIESDITIQSGLIEGNSTNFRLLYVAPGASLTLDRVSLRKGRIINPTGDALGGAIYSDGALDISSSQVYWNDVEGDVAGGGAIYIGSGGSLTINGISDISFNESNGVTSGDGGAIYAEGPINNITARFIASNTATGSGGSIYANTITNISATEISGYAGESGGGIYANYVGSIDGSTFSYSVATNGNGGGLALTNGFSSITNSTFNFVYAQFGGALSVESTNGATGTIDNSDFIYNCAGQAGRDIWLGSEVTVSIASSLFGDPDLCDEIPHGLIAGGSIYSKGNLYVSNSTFEEHSGLHMQNTGGAIHNQNGTLVVEDSEFNENQVLGETFAAGGAIYSEGDLTARRNVFFAADTLILESGISKGGAIYSVGQAEIVDNKFFSTLALSEVTLTDGAGGAIYAEGQADITNNFFNISAVGSGLNSGVPDGSGGAIYLDASQASTVRHNTFVNGIALNGEVMYASGPVSVEGNIFASDGYPEYDDNPDCMLLSGVTGSNNLHLAGDTSCDSISSGTIELGTHINESNGLLQSVYGNPAIDGNPGCGLATDGLGNPRIGACDIGYHELQLDNPTPTPPITALSVSAACNNPNLEVTITSGEGPFNITASAGINTPVTGVGIGTTTINGPEKWDNLTVNETGGNMETTNLGTFRCRSDERPVPLSPAHRSRTTNPFPTFSWTGITGANNYRVFVFDDASPATRTVDIRQNSGGPTTMILSTPLPTGRLFWRVRARTNRVWSYWSIRFTLFVDPPSFQPAGVTPVPTIDLEQSASTPIVPAPAPPTVPAPPNSR